MKQVKAFIKPNRLDDVVLALHKIDRLTGISVSEIRGFGRGRGREDGSRDTEEVYGFLPHLKVEVICHDDLVGGICEAIRAAAHTGLRGDGKIYVSSTEQAVRIDTGEKGEDAV